MANFQTRRTFTTQEAVLTVDPGLPVGSYKFQLVVVDHSGNRSKPAEIVVNIFRPPGIPGPIGPLPRGPIDRPLGPHN